jgi:anti-sigma factor ChrR (cupin superfamily)
MTNQEMIQETAALYALGSLSQHEARAFERLIAEGNQDAVSALRDFEAVVNLIGLQDEAQSPSADIKRQLIACTATMPASNVAHPELPPGLMHLRATEGTWFPYLDGISARVLAEDRKNHLISVLLKMEPGSKIPGHRHQGLEKCYVLEGDFNIGDQQYGPGDYQEAAPGSIHPEIFTKSGATVLIIGPPEYDLV